MTTHNLLPPPRLVAAGGPVSAALRTMLASADDGERERLRFLRAAISARIEADIALLDQLDGEADDEDGADDEPSLCGIGNHEPGGMMPSVPAYIGGTGLHPYDLEHDEAERGVADMEAMLEVRGLYA